MRLGPAFLALLLVTGVRAEEGRGDGKGPNASLVNEEGGAIFGLKGVTSPYPDGTLLHVTLRAKSRTRDVVCALFQIEVQKNAYSGGQTWPGKRLAPLDYELEVMLLVDKQPEAVRKWVMKEYGFVHSHQEALARVGLKVGTPEEQLEFTKDNLNTILGQAKELEALLKEVQGAVATPAESNPTWAETHRSLNTRTIEFRKAFELYRAQFVVLLEQGFFSQILEILKNVSRCVHDHSQGAKVNEKLVAEGKRLKSMMNVVSDMVPGELKPIVHPDEGKDNKKKGADASGK